MIEDWNVGAVIAFVSFLGWAWLVAGVLARRPPRPPGAKKAADG